MSDKQLHEDVLEALRWEPSIREAELGVSVKGGVVTLTGTVDSFAEKYEATRVVEKLAGVKAVADEVSVKLPSSASRSDTDIAHAVVNALRWSVQVPRDRIKARVADGWVTLEGEVDWRFQANAAERAVRYLSGVKGVASLIRISPKKVSTYEVGEKIKEALRRHAELNADRITVKSTDGTVTLNGTVRSYAERRDAEYAAWSAPGVLAVEDHIVVSP